MRLVVYMKSFFVLAGRNYFRSFIKQAIVFSFKILIFSSKYRLHLLDPPV